MPIAVPPSLSPVAVRQSMRTISNDLPVRGANGDPAQGRTIMVIGKTAFGQYAVLAETRTDVNGDYSITIAAGANDRFIVVAVGDAMADEHTRALGNITGAA